MTNERVREAVAEQEAFNELLTVKEYATRYGLHVQSVYSAIRYRRFKLPIVRLMSRSIRIKVPRESIQGLNST